MNDRNVSPKAIKGARRFDPVAFLTPQPKVGQFQSTARTKLSFRRAKPPMRFSILKRASSKLLSYPSKAKKQSSRSWVLTNSWVKDA